MATIGERYGGTIDKFVGDAVIIFFGAPDSTWVLVQDVVPAVPCGEISVKEFGDPVRVYEVVADGQPPS